MFADLALARRLERAEAHANARFVEAWARAYPDSGATWIDVAGAYGMFDGVQSPTTQSFGFPCRRPGVGAPSGPCSRPGWTWPGARGATWR